MGGGARGGRRWKAPPDTSFSARRLRLRTASGVRIVFDVSPLSHERTGVNNYIRGSLAGLAAAAQREGHEVVAFAPTSPEGRRTIPEALDGIPVEQLSLIHI